MVAAGRQKNLVLILARELAENLATPTFIADEDGRLVYYNEPAEAILGKRFSEANALLPQEWTSRFSIEELDGTPLTLEDLPAGVALLERRPAHREIALTGLDGVRRTISVTAIPLFARASEFVGLFTIFWEHEPDSSTG
jgi:PAS domain-containing protein